MSARLHRHGMEQGATDRRKSFGWGNVMNRLVARRSVLAAGVVVVVVLGVLAVLRGIVAAPASAVVQADGEPWGSVVALGRVEAGSWRFDCAATAIAPGKLLTAAHCVRDREVSYGVRPTVASGSVTAVRRVHRHPASFVRSDPQYTDLAVVEVDPALAIPIVPVADRAHETGLGELRGWQAEHEVLRRRAGSLSGRCGQVIVCGVVLEPAGSVCPGDSGSPLVVSSAGGDRVAAVLTGAARCAPGDGAFSAMPVSVNPWLKQFVGEPGQGTR